MSLSTNAIPTGPSDFHIPSHAAPNTNPHSEILPSLPDSLYSQTPTQPSSSILSNPLVIYLGGFMGGVAASVLTDSTATGCVFAGLTWGYAIYSNVSNTNRAWEERVNAFQTQQLPAEDLEIALQTLVSPSQFFDPHTGHEIQSAVGILSDSKLVIYDENTLEEFHKDSLEFEHPLTGQILSKDEIVSLPKVQDQINQFRQQRRENYSTKSLDQTIINNTEKNKLPEGFKDPTTGQAIKTPVGIASDSELVVYDISTFEQIFNNSGWQILTQAPHPLHPDQIIQKADIVNLHQVNEQIQNYMMEHPEYLSLEDLAALELQQQINTFASQKLNDADFDHAMVSGELPNEFRDPIFMSLIEEPVGILTDTTLRPYNKSSLDELFQRSENGLITNPVTRQPVSKEDIVALPEVKKQIDEFRKNHPDSV